MTVIPSDKHAALAMTLTTLDAARAQLLAYALTTDEPAHGAVEAADLLDAARAALGAE